MFGSDVKALYPSIKLESTGKIIRKMVEKTKLTFEGFNYECGLAYISMNTHLTTEVEEIKKILPTRKSGRSTKLKMSAVKQDWDPREKFNFNEQELTEQERKMVVARVIEIATRALFENHAYKFGDETYKQENGGSIGDRWTGSAAELVVQDWAEKYEDILVNSGLEVELLAGYVDDGRQGTTTLAPGMRYDKNKNKFVHSEEGLEYDKKQQELGETRNQRMARVCKEAMNSINKDLEFTVECEDDFPDKKLPTLDFKLWQEPDGKINHTYYQKEMKTPLVIMARSGVSTQQKIHILSNKVTRRLNNINKDKNPQSEFNRVIDENTQELKNSGYTHKTAREIITSGIRGWNKRMKRKAVLGQEQYRIASKTLSIRTRKKLTSRENWYKTRINSIEENDDNDKINTTNSRHYDKKRLPRSLLTRKDDKKPPTGQEDDKITRAVMFVPFTPNSELARALRENEEKLEKLTRTKVKIVERTGRKLVDLVTKSNPWQGQDCQRMNCLLCTTKLHTEKNKTQECTKRNLVYETKCLTCEENEGHKIENMDISDEEKRTKKKNIKLFKYIGETSRSSFERGWEHCNDMAMLKPKSHMLKHVIMSHPGQDMSEVKFGMKVVQFCKTSFERQIAESVIIQQEKNTHHILNSKAEYNRCSLPRLSTKLGNKELQDLEKELAVEKQEQETLESKIRELR